MKEGDQRKQTADEAESCCHGEEVDQFVDAPSEEEDRHQQYPFLCEGRSLSRQDPEEGDDQQHGQRGRIPIPIVVVSHASFGTHEGEGLARHVRDDFLFLRVRCLFPSGVTNGVPDDMKQHDYRGGAEEDFRVHVLYTSDLRTGFMKVTIFEKNNSGWVASELEYEGERR